MTAVRRCPLGCGAQVIFPDDRFPPLDRVPDHLGNVAASQDVFGQWHARFLNPAGRPGPTEKRFALHSRSCAAAQDVLPVTDLETWRARKIQTVTPAKTRRRGGRRGKRHAT